MRFAGRTERIRFAMNTTTPRATVMPLTAANLHGVWPALLTPWTDDERVDEDRLVAEVRHYADAGVHGIYTGGTAGEFYAQDDATFDQITRLVCRTAHDLNLPVQIGCTALSTRTVCLRIATARSYGADGIQFALPFWLALGDDEVLRFLRDIAAAAESTPLILYHTGRAKRRIDPPLLKRICEQTPTLIGMKDTVADVPTFESIHEAAPHLAIFGADCRLTERMSRGGRGTYTSLAGLNAAMMLRYFQLCAENNFDEAAAIERIFQGLMDQVLIPMVRDEGLNDSAVDRVQRMAGGGQCGLRCARPYTSATEEHVMCVLTWCRDHAPELLQDNRTPSTT